MENHTDCSPETRNRHRVRGPLALVVAMTTAMSAVGPAAATPTDYVVLPGGVVANALSAEEMEVIHGEGLPKWAVNQAVKAVSRALGNAAGRQLERLLSGASTPSFAEFRNAFGTRAALVLTLLPEILKPKIAR